MSNGTTDEKQRVFIAWVDDPSQKITFDATVSENHESTSDISDNPIESGSDISDHISKNPDAISIVGVVTDDPLVVNRSQNATAASTGGDPNARANDAYAFLQRTQDLGKLCTVFTTLRTYDNMVIRGNTVVRTKDKSRIVEASLDMRQIFISTTEAANLPTPREATRRRKSKQGKKTKLKESEANQRSALSNLAGAQTTAFFNP